MANNNHHALPQAKMEDVAQRAGVSISTVSRVLRSPGKVAAATRRRIARAMREVGYVHNLVAGSLALRHTEIIAAVVPRIVNTAYGNTIDLASELLRNSGYHLLLGHHDFSSQTEEAIVTAFLGRRPDGFILQGRRHTPQTVRLLTHSGIPIVEMGELVGKPIDTVVSFSNFNAAQAMTAYLVGRGYRRIGIVMLPKSFAERHYLRWKGYRAGLEQHGLPYSTRRVVETTLGYQGGAEALLELLKRDPRVDAVFFTCDVLAVGALFECQRRGWKVPERVAIAGFDDQEMAVNVVPSLTTVHVPREEIGRITVQVLLDRIHGKSAGPRVIDVGTRLMRRDSA